MRSGGVIAYPTEAVWGLGCDPLLEESVLGLLALKQRPVWKGLILVASDFAQLHGYLGPVSTRQRAMLEETWPGPVTWLCPPGPKVADWVRGAHPLIALRVSAHPVVRAICELFGRPVVSTSANRSGAQPARTALEVRRYFGSEVDCVVSGAIGGAARPTRIMNLLSGATVRD